MDSQRDVRIVHRLTYRWVNRRQYGGMYKEKTELDGTVENSSVDRKTLTIALVPTVIFAVTSPVIRDTQFVGALKPVSEVARLIQS